MARNTEDGTFESLDNAGFSERCFAGTYDIIPDLDPLFGPIPDNEPAGWDGWYQDLYHLPDTWEIPGEIGDPDSDPIEFDLIEALGQWEESGGDADFQWVAWFHNQAIPRVTPIFGPDAGRLNTTGPWNANTENQGLTQMRPGEKNALRFDDEGERIWYEE